VHGRSIEPDGTAWVASADEANCWRPHTTKPTSPPHAQPSRERPKHHCADGDQAKRAGPRASATTRNRTANRATENFAAGLRRTTLSSDAQRRDLLNTYAQQTRKMLNHAQRRVKPPPHGSGWFERKTPPAVGLNA